MTKAIPIVNNRDKNLSEDETDHRFGILLADYRDYAFYSRVVEGMRRAQDHTRDIALRYENQAMIDGIVRTRYNQCISSPQELSLSPISVRNFGDDDSSSRKHGPTQKRKHHRELRRYQCRHDLRLSETLEVFEPTVDEPDLIFDIDL